MLLLYGQVRGVAIRPGQGCCYRARSELLLQGQVRAVAIGPGRGVAIGPGQGYYYRARAIAIQAVAVGLAPELWWV